MRMLREAAEAEQKHRNLPEAPGKVTRGFGVFS